MSGSSKNDAARARRVLALGALLLLALLIRPEVAASAPNRPPRVSPITATFVRPVTTYRVRAADPDGDRLGFAWSKTNQRPCGTFTSTANVAQWSHPDADIGGNCPTEAFHPGTISVVVTDGHFRCRAIYPFGSAPGIGPQPQCAAVGGGPKASASPKASPKASTVPSSSPAQSPATHLTATPLLLAPAGRGSSAYPWALLGAGGAALVATGGALALRDRAKSKGCARELLAVARARADYHQATDGVRRALALAQEAWADYDAVKKEIANAKAEVEKWTGRLRFLEKLVAAGPKEWGLEETIEHDIELARELRTTRAEVLREHARVELERLKTSVGQHLQAALGNAELRVQRAVAEIGARRASVAPARAELRSAEDNLARCQGIAAGKRLVSSIIGDGSDGCRARPCLPIPTVSGGPRRT